MLSVTQCLLLLLLFFFAFLFTFLFSLLTFGCFVCSFVYPFNHQSLPAIVPLASLADKACTEFHFFSSLLAKSVQLFFLLTNKSLELIFETARRKLITGDRTRIAINFSTTQFYFVKKIKTKNLQVIILLFVNASFSKENKIRNHADCIFHLQQYWKCVLKQTSTLAIFLKKWKNL